MNILLDTCVLIWWIQDSERLSQKARDIFSSESALFLSAASGWEIAIKFSLGKLKIPYSPDRFIATEMKKNQIQSLPILMSHGLYISKLPMHHADPFDRVIISQALLENMVILTPDPKFTSYKARIIW